MDPISLNTGLYPTPFPGMRPVPPSRHGTGIDQSVGGPTAAPMGNPAGVQEPPKFDNVLGDLVKEVNTKQWAAADKVTGLLSGQNVPLHDAMISMEEASVSFSLMLEVRNKLLEGYQELMRMQI